MPPPVAQPRDQRFGLGRQLLRAGLDKVIRHVHLENSIVTARSSRGRRSTSTSAFISWAGVSVITIGSLAGSVSGLALVASMYGTPSRATPRLELELEAARDYVRRTSASCRAPMSRSRATPTLSRSVSGSGREMRQPAGSPCAR
jgi:hypothetical protein